LKNKKIEIQALSVDSSVNTHPIDLILAPFDSPLFYLSNDTKIIRVSFLRQAQRMILLLFPTTRRQEKKKKKKKKKGRLGL
jgi:hypothetical protein